MTTLLHNIAMAPDLNQVYQPTGTVSIADHEHFFYAELRAIANGLDDRDSSLMEEEVVVRRAIYSCEDPHQYLLLEQRLSDIAQERIQIDNCFESFERAYWG